MNKRQLYNELFPDRIAINSNKHYTRITKPELLRIKQRKAGK